jgi:hypothetical protein
MAFLLLRGLGPGLEPGIRVLQAPAAREGEARLERVCSVSRDPGCCTLLLYGQSWLFELES